MLIKKSVFSHLGTVIMSLLLCFAFCIPNQCIGESEQLHSIKLICHNDDIILTGMEWNLYRIGERHIDKIVLSGAFSDYPVDMSDLSEENVEQIAKTLESYAVADDISPVMSGATDGAGELSFDSLSRGVYLAVGKKLKIDYTCYVASSLILEVRDSDVSFSYDAFPKFKYATLGSEQMSYTVRKVWINDTSESVEYPPNVTIDLFKNGELYDTVILNTDNKWEHHWTDLDNSNKWYVVERNIPVNYTVLIDFNSTQYIIKNSYTSIETSSVVTDITTATPIDFSTTYLINTSAKTTMTVPQTSVTSLPPLAQTGQPWMAVIILSSSGILLLIIGLMIKKRNNDE